MTTSALLSSYVGVMSSICGARFLTLFIDCLPLPLVISIWDRCSSAYQYLGGLCDSALLALHWSSRGVTQNASTCCRRARVFDVRATWLQGQGDIRCIDRRRRAASRQVLETTSLLLPLFPRPSQKATISRGPYANLCIGCQCVGATAVVRPRLLVRASAIVEQECCCTQSPSKTFRIRACRHG